MITITFNPQNDEHVQILAQAMMDILNSVEPEQADEPAPEPVKEAPAKKPKVAKVAPVAEAPVKSEPAFTLEQVRAKLYALKQGGKDVGALIAATGHPNLTAIPADEYPALMANAEKM